MSEGMSEMAGTDGWGGLLEEARHALSTLRAEDLEELAERAERMFDATGGRELRPHGRPELRGAELLKVATEHRLLGDLLRATVSNLEVLRRRGVMRDRRHAGEVNSRWVR